MAPAHYYPVDSKSEETIHAVEEEEPKAVLGGLKRRLWGGLLVHLAPIAGCATIITLYWRQSFWEDISQTMINSLQLVAKIQELLVILSLGTVALHHAKRHLLLSKGLPLGLVASGHRVGDIWMLLERSFWSHIVEDISFMEWRSFKTFIREAFIHQNSICRLWLFILFSTLLSVLVGPATAIVIIPIQDYWRSPHPFSNFTMPIHFISPRDTMWPSNITDGSLANYPECLQPTIDNITCPAVNYELLLQWTSAYYLAGASTSLDMAEIFGSTRRKITTEVMPLDPHIDASFSVAVSSTPLRFVTRTIGSLWNYVSENDIGDAHHIKQPRFQISETTAVFQPLVQVECQFITQDIDFNGTMKWSENPIMRSNEIMRFNQTLKKWTRNNNTDNDEDEYNWVLPNWTTEIPNTTVSSAKYKWAFGSDGPSYDSSASIVVQIPVVLEVEENSETHKFATTGLVPCVIDATWFPAAMTYTPTLSNLVNSNITDPLLSLKKMEGPGQKIHISQEWMKFLDIPNINNENQTLLDTMLNTFVSEYDSPELGKYTTFMPLIFDEEAANNGPTTISVLLANLITDGLSSINYQENDDAYIQPSVPESTAPGNVTMVDLYLQHLGTTFNESLRHSDIINGYTMDIDVERYGYAYGAKISTVHFGMAIIYIYLAVIGAYIFYACVDQYQGPHPFTVVAWSEIPELIVLALQSKPSQKLVNTSMGAEVGRRWADRVHVKVNQENAMELVMVDERPEMKDLI